MLPGRDVYYDEAVKLVTDDCPCAEMNAEDPLFILYTSGSTGQPKGVLHTTGGYLVWAAMTHQYVFDYHDGDIYWCTADVGWVTGHTYILYGPLANGATTLMFEGIPTYPSISRFWEVVDKHQVNIFYTAPTAIRSLMQAGEEPVRRTSRRSLRLLGSVGEPINPEAWEWYHRVVGDGRCPIVDTWWQTETGGILITPLPGAIPQKPGSATKPFFGVKPVVVDADGKELAGACEGNLCIADSWPGQMRTVFGDHERFVQTYFSTYPGKYFTGDGCRRDGDGYYWITGRVDDVINVSGHRMGTAEVESALVAHPKVSEAAVVGYPHDIKGQGIYAYVTLMTGEDRVGRAAQGARRLGPEGDRPDRLAGPDPVRPRPAQDPLGQDHAPHPAQDRRGRVRRARRHLDARRPGRRRRPDLEPAEQARGGGLSHLSRRERSRRRSRPGEGLRPVRRHRRTPLPDGLRGRDGAAVTGEADAPPPEAVLCPATARAWPPSHEAPLLLRAHLPPPLAKPWRRRLGQSPTRERLPEALRRQSGARCRWVPWPRHQPIAIRHLHPYLAPPLGFAEALGGAAPTPNARMLAARSAAAGDAILPQRKANKARERIAMRSPSK